MSPEITVAQAASDGRENWRGAMTDEKASRRWRHVKRGTFYTEVDRAELQVSNDPPAEGECMVIYRGDDGYTWVRSSGEFGDGRFEEAAPVVDHKTALSERQAGLPSTGERQAAEITRLRAALQVSDALYDSAYIAGLKLGWSLANAGDNAGFAAAVAAAVAARTGYLAPITKARDARNDRTRSTLPDAPVTA